MSRSAFAAWNVGEALLQRCAALTRAKGGDLSCGWLSMSDNFGAQGFYESSGISHCDDEQIHAAYGDAFQALADGDRRNERGTA